jgi:hypothetical protein
MPPCCFISAVWNRGFDVIAPPIRCGGGAKLLLAFLHLGLDYSEHRGQIQVKPRPDRLYNKHLCKAAIRPLFCVLFSKNVSGAGQHNSLHPCLPPRPTYKTNDQLLTMSSTDKNTNGYRSGKIKSMMIPMSAPMMMSTHVLSDHFIPCPLPGGPRKPRTWPYTPCCCP